MNNETGFILIIIGMLCLYVLLATKDMIEYKIDNFSILAHIPLFGGFSNPQIIEETQVYDIKLLKTNINSTENLLET